MFNRKHYSSSTSMKRAAPARLFCCVGFALLAFASATAQAESVKIGVLKISAAATAFVGQEKGYFAAEDLQSELVYFDASEPVAVAVTSHAVDFGASGFSAGLIALAAQGALKVISGGYSHQAPGFHSLSYIVATQAYANGFTSLKNFPGHSVAISQVGSPPHYALGLLIEKYGFDPMSIRVMPLQTIGNMISAVKGGQSDSSILTATASLPLVERGGAKLLGWVDDETPFELGALYTSTLTADKRRDTVERFLRAWRKAARDCHDAFADASGKWRFGDTAPAIIAILAKYTRLPDAAIKLAAPYCDPEARLDVKDLAHQIAWYKAQGMIKAQPTAEEILDRRYVVPLPGQ